jgi:hypothetical protein
VLSHAGGLGWDELALFGAVLLFLGWVFLRARRAGREEGGPEGAAPPDGATPSVCSYCGAPVDGADERCAACGFRLRGRRGGG